MTQQGRDMMTPSSDMRCVECGRPTQAGYARCDFHIAQVENMTYKELCEMDEENYNERMYGDEEDY